jgi:hypothetical protein
MRHRRAACVVASALLTCAISACGGSSSGNDVASKSANGIVSAAASAINGAQSAHISGSLVSSGTPISVNLDLVSGKGGRGDMSQGGLGFQIVVTGNEVYINGSQAFWRHFGGATAAQLFHGKWLKAPASGQFASLAKLSNLHVLLGKLLMTHGTLVKSGTSTVGGQSVVGVHDTSKNATLYVATTGQPYPLEIVKTGAQAGRITLNHFNEAVTLTPPANAIDISSLK